MIRLSPGTFLAQQRYNGMSRAPRLPIEIMKIKGTELSTKRATSERAIIRVVVMASMFLILASRCSFCFSLHKRDSSFKTLTPSKVGNKSGNKLGTEHYRTASNTQ